MIKTFLALLLLLLNINVQAQNEITSEQFWTNLSKHCGNAYEGHVVEAPENDIFRDKRLVIHFRSCEEGTIKIPFAVGQDKSRTWILKFKKNMIELKHDHRHEDGSSEEVTMYGGAATNQGLADLQVFPADFQTSQMLPAAASNIWWLTLTENTLTYNLRRIGTDRLFTIAFDLSTPVSPPEGFWGWQD